MTNVTWTRECSECAREVAAHHYSPDVRSRAEEIYRGARIGQTLTPLNVEFITAMRSRFDPFISDPSKSAQAAFERAWSAAWDAAK
jgi:hypothetical protein